MGYFSNGTEGMDYEEKYCARCIHQNGCAVLLAHHLHNYKECNNPDNILHILIPRDEISNGQCTMFVESSKVYVGTPPARLSEWMDKNGIIAVKPS